MSDTPHTIVKSAPDTMSEVEVNSLATIYRRAIARYEEANVKEKGGCPSAPNNADRRSNGIDANSILHDQHRT